MKRRRYLRYYLFCLLVLSSNKLFAIGLDIHETAHIHNDGSGQFEIAADLTKVEHLIKVASLFANVPPEVAQQRVREALSEAADSLKNVPGIHNIAMAHDTKMLCFKLGFHFNSIKALNSAIQELHTHAGHPGHTYFKMGPNSFVRVDTQSIAQLLAYYHAQADQPIANLSLKTLSDIVTYHLTYRFDKKISTTTHALATISEDRFTLSLKQPLFDENERELSLNSKILF